MELLKLMRQWAIEQDVLEWQLKIIVVLSLNSRVCISLKTKSKIRKSFVT